MTRARRADRALRFTPTRVGTTSIGYESSAITYGSPPRAWGQRASGVPSAGRLRFTPTRVGTTSPHQRPATLPRSVHPHARGETASRYRSGNGRARFTPTRVGTDSRSRQMTRRYRFTPTRVGTTRQLSRVSRQRVSVHPHARGDCYVYYAGRCAAIAVHPHARGDCIDRWRCQFRRCRFTPTRVGTTMRLRSVSASRCGSPPRAWGRRASSVCDSLLGSVHPHARGDDDAGDSLLSTCRSVHPHARGDITECAVSNGAGNGSPPRAWGHRRRRSARWARRFTPTRVGTTRLTSWIVQGVSVHPHARGDIVARVPYVLRHPRFTPTRVGTSLIGRCVAPARRAVHPHARGDNVSPVVRCFADVGGSPPRAWGHADVARLGSCSYVGSPPRAWGRYAYA